MLKISLLRTQLEEYIMERDAIATATQALALDGGIGSIQTWIALSGAMVAWIGVFFAYRNRKGSEAEADRAHAEAEKANSFRGELAKTQTEINQTQKDMISITERIEKREEERRKRTIISDIDSRINLVTQFMKKHGLNLANPTRNPSVTPWNTLYEPFKWIISRAHSDVSSQLKVIIDQFLIENRTAPFVKKLFDDVLDDLKKLRSKYTD